MMTTAPSHGSAAIAPPLHKGRRRFWPLDPVRRMAMEQSLKSNRTGEGEGNEAEPIRVLRGVIFDVDGTLCLPQNYMFREMREALGIPKSTDILTHIRSLPTRPERAAAVRKIQSIERRAMTKQRPQPHLLELMQHLEKRGVRKGLCTRNFPAPVEHLREHFLPGIGFEGVVTRDTPGIRAKPEGDGLWMIVEGWNERDKKEKKEANGQEQHSHEDPGTEVKPDTEIEKPPSPRPASVSASTLTSPTLPQNLNTNPKGPISDIIDEATTTTSSPSSSLPPPPSTNPYHPLPPSTSPLTLRHTHGPSILMVGDSIDDLLAGRNAGAATALLMNDENAHLKDHESCDLAVGSLGELKQLLEGGFVGEER